MPGFDSTAWPRQVPRKAHAEFGQGAAETCAPAAHTFTASPWQAAEPQEGKQKRGAKQPQKGSVEQTSSNVNHRTQQKRALDSRKHPRTESYTQAQSRQLVARAFGTTPKRANKPQASATPKANHTIQQAAIHPTTYRANTGRN